MQQVENWMVTTKRWGCLGWGRGVCFCWGLATLLALRSDGLIFLHIFTTFFAFFSVGTNLTMEPSCHWATSRYCWLEKKLQIIVDIVWHSMNGPTAKTFQLKWAIFVHHPQGATLWICVTIGILVVETLENSPFTMWTEHRCRNWWKLANQFTKWLASFCPSYVHKVSFCQHHQEDLWLLPTVKLPFQSLSLVTIVTISPPVCSNSFRPKSSPGNQVANGAPPTNHVHTEFGRSKKLFGTAGVNECGPG